MILDFTDAVIACIRNAESILIFGPGEAKGELKTRLVRCKLGGRIAAMETADKLTDRQIAAKVHAYFVEKADGQEGGRHAQRQSSRTKNDRALRKRSSTSNRERHHDND